MQIRISFHKTKFCQYVTVLDAQEIVWLNSSLDCSEEDFAHALSDLLLQDARLEASCVWAFDCSCEKIGCSEIAKTGSGSDVAKLLQMFAPSLAIISNPNGDLCSYTLF